VKDVEGWPLIFYACQLDRLEVVEALFDQGVDPNTTGGPGISLLAFLILNDCNTSSTSMIKLLLARGADASRLPKSMLDIVSSCEDGMSIKIEGESKDPDWWKDCARKWEKKARFRLTLPVR
jgi:hypothetical protein